MSIQRGRCFLICKKVTIEHKGEYLKKYKSGIFINYAVNELLLQYDRPELGRAFLEVPWPEQGWSAEPCILRAEKGTVPNWKDN